MPSGLFDLTGKTTIVTGGNSGLGRGFARGIAKQGGNLVIWARSSSKNDAVKREFESLGARVSTRVVDVSSETEVATAMKEAVEEFGKVDAVIANAGISTPAPSLFDLTTDSYHELLAINLHGGFFTLREGARHMMERAKGGDPGGSLIVCGSLSVYLGIPGMQHYAAAKGALAAIIRGMCVELGKYGIRANMVAPGYVKTDLGREQGDLSATEAVFAQNTPIPRVGRPEDFEGIAAYLVSDCSAFHTGDTLVVDGGYLVNL